jgi:hypothetical protein
MAATHASGLRRATQRKRRRHFDVACEVSVQVCSTNRSASSGSAVKA